MEDDEGWVLPVSRLKFAKISTITNYGTSHAVAAPVANFPSPPIIAAMSRTAPKRRQLHRFSATRAASLQPMHRTPHTRPAPSRDTLLRSSATVPSIAEELVEQQRRCSANNPHLYRVPPPPAASLSTMLHPKIQPQRHHNTSPLILLQFELRFRQTWTNWRGASRSRNQRQRRHSHRITRKPTPPLPHAPPPKPHYSKKNQSTLLPFDGRSKKT